MMQIIIVLIRAEKLLDNMIKMQAQHLEYLN